MYSINEQYSHKADSEQKSAYTLNGDGYIKDDTLYLLIPEYGDHFKKNRIMMLDLQSGEILPTVLVLKGSSYSSFCVGNNHLFVSMMITRRLNAMRCRFIGFVKIRSSTGSGCTRGEC